MSTAEVEITNAAPAFASPHPPSHDPGVSAAVQYRSGFDSFLSDPNLSWLLNARTAAMWRRFGVPSTLTASDRDDTAPVHSPEDEPLLADLWRSLVDYGSVLLSSLSRPSSEELEQILNWDFAIEAEPKRRTGTIQVTLEFAGRDKPLPEENPWAT